MKKAYLYVFKVFTVILLIMCLNACNEHKEIKDDTSSDTVVKGFTFPKESKNFDDNEEVYEKRTEGAEESNSISFECAKDSSLGTLNESGILIIQEKESSADQIVKQTIVDFENQTVNSFSYNSNESQNSYRDQWNWDLSKCVFACTNDKGSGLFNFSDNEITWILWNKTEDNVIYKFPHFTLGSNFIIFIKSTNEKSQLGIVNLKSNEIRYSDMEISDHIVDMRYNRFLQRAMILTNKEIIMMHSNDMSEIETTVLPGEIDVFSYSPMFDYFSAIINVSDQKKLFLFDSHLDEIELISSINTQYVPVPQWSPDGKSFVFHNRAVGYEDVFLYNVATGKLKNITHTPNEKVLISTDKKSGKKYNTWNRSSDYFAFTSYQEDMWSEHKTVLFDCEQKKLLYPFSFEENETFVQWGLDLTFSVITGSAHENQNMAIHNVKTKDTTEVNLHEDEILSSTWSTKTSSATYIYNLGCKTFLELKDSKQNTIWKYEFPESLTNDILVNWYD